MTYPNIEAERIRTGMSWSGLARAVGVSTGTLKRWQDGHTEIRASKIAALSRLFGVTSDYLLGREERRTIGGHA
jgi:transcriptional regulator with XRE-family HTH domain